VPSPVLKIVLLVILYLESACHATQHLDGVWLQLPALLAVLDFSQLEETPFVLVALLLPTEDVPLAIKLLEPALVAELDSSGPRSMDSILQPVLLVEP